jgi:hypothetical protein
VIGVLFLIFGFIQGVTTSVKLITFDQYPLNSYEETRCQYMSSIDSSLAPEIVNEKRPSQEDMDRQRNQCQEQLEFERRVRKTENITTSITTLVAGAILVISFRRFIFSSGK